MEMAEVVGMVLYAHQHEQACPWLQVVSLPKRKEDLHPPFYAKRYL
jgi:hypothetical protein